MARRNTETGLLIEVAGKRYPVPSIEAASALISKTRDKTGVRSSEYDPAHIFETSGKLLGHVAYNGRVFAGRAREWRSETELLFDPSVALGERQAL